MKDYQKKRIIIATVVLLVLIGIALAVFFCIPRKPTVEYGEVTYFNLTNSNTLFSVTIQIPFTVDNPNYYDIKMKKITLDVDYNGVYVTQLVEDDDYTFGKRGTTTSTIESTLSTSDTTLIPQIQSDIQSGTALNLDFDGDAKLEALAITINYGLSFSKSLLISA